MACASGLVFALATPPFDLYPAVFLGLAGLVWIVARAERPRSAFGFGWLWATSAGLVGMRFVPLVIERFTPLGVGVGWLAHVLLSSAQALPWGIGAAAGVALRRRLHAPSTLAIAVATAIAVSTPSVIPWTPAGLVTPWPALVQLGEIVGERGVSVLFAAWVALLTEPITSGSDALRRERLTRPLGSALAIGALVLVHGSWRVATLRREAPDPVRLALVQAATPPALRWEGASWPSILASLRRQTALAEHAGVELSVWPEAAYPYPMRRDTRTMPRGPREIVGGSVTRPVLFGFLATAAPDVAPDGTRRQDTYNAATVVFPNRLLLPTTDKVELLAFGESVPFGERVPALRRAFQRSGGLRPGDAPRVLEVARADAPPLRVGVLNCYEDTLPSYGRRIARELEPNLLVNVTNDAWFVGTSAPELHLRLAAMRAVELRRDLVRAVNLGPSAWIDASGTVRAASRSSEPDFLVVTPSRRDAKLTRYAELGDAPLWALLVLGSLAAWRRTRTAAT